MEKPVAYALGGLVVGVVAGKVLFGGSGGGGCSVNEGSHRGNQTGDEGRNALLAKASAGSMFSVVDEPGPTTEEDVGDAFGDDTAGAPPEEKGNSLRSHIGSSEATDIRWLQSNVYHSADSGILSDPSFADSRRKSTSAYTLPSCPIWRIAVTGGPCSGKSTCMESVRKDLSALGFRVFIVPEVATLLINGGLDFSQMTKHKRVTQQRVILQTIMMLEDAFHELARSDNIPCVILCDRGTLDGSAYCTKEEWEEVLGITGYTVEELRDARYDAVIHLVTAAIGARDFYTQANNMARRESPEEAADLDFCTRDKWLGHRLIAVIDNSTDFQHKVERVLETIKKVVRVVDLSEEGEGLDLGASMPPLQSSPEYDEDAVEKFVGSHSVGSQTKQLAVKELTAPLPEHTVIAEVLVKHLRATPDFKRERIIRRKIGDHCMYYLSVEKHKLRVVSDRKTSVPNITHARITEAVFSELDKIRSDSKKEPCCKTLSTFFCGNRHLTLATYFSPKQKAGNVVLIVPYDMRTEEVPPYIILEDGAELSP